MAGLNLDSGELRILTSFSAGTTLAEGLTLFGSHLYGMIVSNADYPTGAIFRVPVDAENFGAEIMHSFDEQTEGILPVGRLLELDGWLLGTLDAGPRTNPDEPSEYSGTYFGFNPDSGEFAVLHYFRYEEAYNLGGVFLDRDLRLVYGASLNGGGEPGAGTIFAYQLPQPIPEPSTVGLALLTAPLLHRLLGRRGRGCR